jgi:hypothetical protein
MTTAPKLCKAEYIVKIGEEAEPLTFTGSVKHDPSLDDHQNIERARSQAQAAFEEAYDVYNIDRKPELTSENIIVTLILEAPGEQKVSLTLNQQKPNQKIDTTVRVLIMDLGDRLGDDFSSCGDDPKTWKDAFGGNESYFRPGDNNTLDNALENIFGDDCIDWDAELLAAIESMQESKAKSS